MAGRDPLKPGSGADPLIYSREAAPNTSRLETILSHLLKGPALTYSSGLAAFHALLVALNPKVVAIGDGYHGCHGVLKIFQKLTHCKIVDVHNPDAWEDLGEGDVVHLETPLNPTGEAYEIEKYAKWAHERGAVLTIDATFAPPPLQFPFTLWMINVVRKVFERVRVVTSDRCDGEEASTLSWSIVLMCG